MADAVDLYPDGPAYSHRSIQAHEEEYDYQNREAVEIQYSLANHYFNGIICLFDGVLACLSFV
jgi:hypothetical protein